MTSPYQVRNALAVLLFGLAVIVAAGAVNATGPRHHHKIVSADATTWRPGPPSLPPEAVVQVNGMGPFDMVYSNPADDPRKPN